MAHFKDCSCSSCLARTDKPFISAASLAQNCPLDNYTYSSRNFALPTIQPDPNQRSLQSLPVELYHACLQLLDLQTIVSLRRVSQFTRHIVGSLPEYYELYNHAPQVLRACLSTGMAGHLSIQRLHRSLITVECYYCKNSDNPENNFGSYLSLYEGRRTCLFCLRNNPELRAIELMTLMNLRFQRNSTIDLASTPRLDTLAGHYTGFQNFPHMTRCKLVRSGSVTPRPGLTFTEKESIVIFGNSRSARINHHPLIPQEEESDISPSQDYLSPESHKQITHRYMSVISFPYLVSSRQKGDTGVLCGDCMLSMLFQEKDWKRSQDEQSLGRHRPRASLQRVDIINKARREACKQYTSHEQAMNDALEAKNKGRGQAGMSIQEHRLTHASRKMSNDEKEWRKGFSIEKVPAHSLLRLQQYG